MPTNNGDITFKYGTQNAYNNLSSIDENAIYVTTDTHRIYIGGTDYTDDTQINDATKQYVDASCASVESKIGDVVDEKIGDSAATTTEEWLTEHVNPVGSAVVVDNSLSISGAAADAKATGDTLKNVSDTISINSMSMGANGVSLTISDFTSSDIYLVDGTSNQYTNWCSTPFVYCRGNTIQYSARYFYTASVNVAYIAFFDANKKMTHCLKSSDIGEIGSSGQTTGTITPSENDFYVRCVGRTDVGDYYLKFGTNGVLSVTSQVPSIAQNVSKIDDIVGNPDTVMTYADYPSTQILNVDRTFTVYGAAWKSTGYVPCFGVKTVEYTARALSTSSANIAYLAFFDSNKQVVSMLKSSDLSNPTGYVSGTAQVPQTAYYVMSSGDASACYISFTASGLQQFTQIKATGLNILCIGDSLTRGVINGNVDIIKEGYPYWLSKMLCSEVANAGYPGGKPDTWWARKSQYPQPTQTTTLVTIMFATNGGLETNTIDADVEPYSDYNDYANTAVGCYCKIIEWVMEQTSNNAQIILITPPMNWDSRSEAIAQAKFNIVKNSIPTIYAIAEKYGLPVINGFYESGISKFNKTVFLPADGIHLSAKGYHKFGSFLARKIASMYSEFSQSDTGTVI